MMFFSDVPDGKLYKVDTIEHQGKMWIVSEWLDNPLAGLRKPTRIILLDLLPHQKSSGGPADFVLNDGMPKYIFDGQPPRTPEDARFVVIERPDILFPAIGG